MRYSPSTNRYDTMIYKRCGKSGLKLPVVSLGLWHNFGGVDSFQTAQQILRRAFDLGITHFDLANNYGPPPGSAEVTFGKVLREDFGQHRDEMIVSTKAGYLMWPGPYGDWGSKKYLMASLDQSLKRMALDYVDIFYSHRYDPDTPLEETMEALCQAVQQGKALYVGISNYPSEQTKEAALILKSRNIHCLIHQVKYSMFNREPENDLLDVLENEGIGCIAFSPLAQGLLTDRYLNGIPNDSRAAKSHGFLKRDDINDKNLKKVRSLNKIAKEREQSLSQLALAWALRDKRVTSVLIGVSSTEQLETNIDSLNQLGFSNQELDQIDDILKNQI